MTSSNDGGFVFMDIDNDNEAIDFASEICTEEDKYFDNCIGVLEELLGDQDFNEMHDSFLSENCDHFEDTEENKFIYTSIFQSYISKVESFIESVLSNKIDNFSMDAFFSLLQNRQQEVVGEIWDMLLSFSDFNEFKSNMIAYKKGIALNNNFFSVNSYSLQ